MKLIKHSDLASLSIAPVQYMKWVNEMLLSLYDATIPAKAYISLPNNGFSNTMPCLIPSSDVFGIKVVTRYTDHSPALDATIMLYQASTGTLKAVMDGTLITTMRTGAVAATSILKLRAQKSHYTLGIIGLGVTARASLICLLESSQDDQYSIKIKRYKDQAELFIERFKHYSNVQFSIVETNEDLICDSDIILSCITYTDEIIAQDEWYKAGVLVVPVHTRGFQNCDLFFDRIYGDLTSQISHFGNFNKFKYYNEFAQILQGKDHGRQNDNERILAYNIGIAIHDIFIANVLFEQIMRSNTSIANVEIKESLPKFYI